MSQIFDALVRSEAERDGKGLVAETVATELLKRSEDLGASEFGQGANGDGLDELRAMEQTEVADPLRRVDAEDTARRKESEFTIPLEVGAGPSFAEMKMSLPDRSMLVCLPESRHPAAEAFQLLGIRLRHLRRVRTLRKILITSTIPQEGKSFVAANLACVLAARTQQKVLLLEGDLRRPTQSKVFGFEIQPGICEWLCGEQELVNCIYRLKDPNICILPAGTASAKSMELLQSGRLTEMMDQLTSWFDWIIIDSPPVLPLADTSAWTSLADGILLVVRQGTTQRKLLRRGLDAVNAQKVIGAVLNSSKNIPAGDYYYRPTNELLNDD